MISSLKALTPLDGFKYLITRGDTPQNISNVLVRMYVSFTKVMHTHIEENTSNDITNELFFLGECIFIFNSDNILEGMDKLIGYYASAEYIAAYLFRAYVRYSRLAIKYPDDCGSSPEDIENELYMLFTLIEIFNGVFEVGTNEIAA